MIGDLGQSGDSTFSRIYPAGVVLTTGNGNCPQPVGEDPGDDGLQLIQGVIVEQGVGGLDPLVPATVGDRSGLALLPDVPMLDVLLEELHQLPGVAVGVEPAAAWQKCPGWSGSAPFTG